MCVLHKSGLYTVHVARFSGDLSVISVHVNQNATPAEEKKKACDLMTGASSEYGSQKKRPQETHGKTCCF